MAHVGSACFAIGHALCQSERGGTLAVCRGRGFLAWIITADSAFRLRLCSNCVVAADGKESSRDELASSLRRAGSNSGEPMLPSAPLKRHQQQPTALSPTG